MKTKGLFLLILCSFLCCGCSLFTSPKNEPDEVKATAISFERQYVTVENGGNDYLRYTVEPAEIQNKTDVKFTYDESIISIDPDRYGIVITGKKSGQTYLKGTVNGITATCIITVEGNPDIFEGEPYIYSNFTVIELTPGSNTTVSASLYGGTSVDLENFVWSIKDSDIANLNYARGSCVITAKRTGSTQITVSHPDCKYDYTMILFVYSDKLDSAYITTSQNIVVINKAETASKSITFDVRNPYSQNYQNGFSYEVISENSEPCFSVIGNGNTAIITPERNGLSVLRVSHDMCEYTLDVIVKVTTAIENVYIKPSVSILNVEGSDRLYSIYAEIEGTNKFADPDRFTWQVLENDTGLSASECMDWTVSGNQISIQGKKNGAFKVKVSHELSEYSRTVLVILSKQDGSAIDASMYISTTANYVQTKVGDTTTEISVQLMGGEPGDENDLDWKIENGENNDICKIITPTGHISARAAGSMTDGKLYITPLKAGTATVSVSHPKILYSTDIVIKVLSEYALTAEPVYIDSDLSLVRMLNGSTQEISVELSGNKASGDENGIQWQSEDSSVVSVSPASGKTVVLSAVSSGSKQTYVSASHSKALSEKKILVLTADTQEELDSMKGIYTDNSYVRLNANGTESVEMKSFGLEAVDLQNIRWASNDSSICSVQADSSNRLKATVYGYSSGKTTVKASLDGAEDCVFDITVLPEGEDTGVILPSYLTTTQNALVIPKAGESANLKITGVNISESDMMNTIWSSEDNSIATVNGNGSTAVVNAVAEGRTRIKISNTKSNNVLYVDIKVGALYEWADDFYVYITTEQDTFSMVKGDTLTFGAALENSTERDGFSFTSSKPDIVEAAGSLDGLCILQAKEAGMAEITIRNYYADFEKTVLAVVSNSKEELEGIRYLTTSQNVVTVGEANNQVVTVSVENAKEEILTGFEWRSSNESIVKVVGSGSHAVFYGIKEGTAKITVTNYDAGCDYPLEIIANCVDPVMAAANPYITCQNIVTLHVGDDVSTLTADLVGGTEADKQHFTWLIQDSSIATLYWRNETAQVKALKPGTTQLVISNNAKPGIVDRTVLIICEPAVVYDCYITVTESIIKMSPSDGNKTITATLVNGSANDAYNFKWWADDYNIIDMNYVSESCVITPIATGNTTIHCSHPKAAYQKDIILYISRYDEFAFAQNSVTVTKGKQSFVNMEVPTTNIKTMVRYSVKKTDGSGASDVCSASGTDSVCIITPNKEGNCIIYAELVSVNSGIVQSTAQLLVNVQPSNVSRTYINYTGDTVLPVSKDQKFKLKATLAGENAVTGDEKDIRWKVSDSRILSISPSPSANGWSKNSEVQITALQAGKEATITISHDKADDNIILYVIIEGENVANILLDRTAMNLIQGDSPQLLTATITNAQENDYENLEWNVENVVYDEQAKEWVRAQNQTDAVVKISGSGRKISVLPKLVGSARVTATVPSSLRKAECIITVEPPKQILFDKNSIKVYPGEGFTINYTVSPAGETNTVTWSTSDSGYFFYNDDKNGTLTCLAKTREGTASITGTTKSLAVATCNINVGWGNTLTLSKSLIRTVPVDNGDGTFDIDFELAPSCGELHILGLINSYNSNIELKEGTYSEKKTENGQAMYVIKKEKFTRVDSQTGIAYGKIRLNPKGEAKIPMVVELWNNARINGEEPVGFITRKNVELEIYYPKYDFTLLPNGSGGKWSDGKYSGFDSTNNIITIGDGEIFQFKVKSLQTNATPYIDGIEFEKSVTSKQDVDRIEHISISKSGNADEGFSLKICNDFSSAGGYLNGSVDSGDAAAAFDQQFNTALLEKVYAGKLKIKYHSMLENTTKYYEMPVYLEIRNCAYNYPN